MKNTENRDKLTADNAPDGQNNRAAGKKDGRKSSVSDALKNIKNTIDESNVIDSTCGKGDYG